MAALLEINFTPAWSIYGSDMYNHGKDKIHYYNVSQYVCQVTYAYSLSYGRTRKGTSALVEFAGRFLNIQC